jgi:hypothetical protein
LNVYLGEAKLYQTFGDAIASVFQSLENMHAGGQVAHELQMVTNHFKFLDDNLRERVSNYLDDTHPEGSFRLTHACLIGYDWTEYAQLEGTKRAQFIADFANRYRKHGAMLAKRLNKQFSAFPHKHLGLEFFFLPFKSVEEFRKAFYDELFEGGA